MAIIFKDSYAVSLSCCTNYPNLYKSKSTSEYKNISESKSQLGFVTPINRHLTNS